MVIAGNEKESNHGQLKRMMENAKALEETKWIMMLSVFPFLWLFWVPDPLWGSEKMSSSIQTGERKEIREASVRGAYEEIKVASEQWALDFTPGSEDWKALLDWETEESENQRDWLHDTRQQFVWQLKKPEATV